jgi:hypothetical protein
LFSKEQISVLYIEEIIQKLKLKKILLNEDSLGEFIKSITEINRAIKSKFIFSEDDFDNKTKISVKVALFNANLIDDISDENIAKYIKGQKSLSVLLNQILRSESNFALKLIKGFDKSKLDISTEENEAVILEMLPKIKSKYPESKFNEFHFYSKDSDDFIKLLNAGIITDLSEEKVIKCIEDRKLNGEQLFKYILNLPIDNSLAYVDKYPELKD